jgi:hypothetical protein
MAGFLNCPLFPIIYLRVIMNQNVKLAVRATAAAALLAMGTAAFAAVDLSANIELDNTNVDGSAVAANDKGLTQAGRVETNLYSKAGTNMFVAARASLLAKKDGNMATDDMWVQMGSSFADVKLGRFEAADLFPLAGDTLVAHAGNVYGANTLRGRKAGDVFHAAGTANFGGGLSLELGLIETTKTNIVGSGTKGVRPVLAYAAGPLTARLGFEAGDFAPTATGTTNKVEGMGLTVGYDFGGFKLAGNVAQGKTDAANNNKQTGMGLTASVGTLSVGFISGTTEIAANADSKVQTFYASYGIPLFDVKGATITPAFSTSTNKTTGVKDLDLNAFRVRVNYTF